MDDKLAQKILEVLTNAAEPLETREVEERIKSETRAKILYRLNDLRGQGKIKGKQVGSGKGTWIWWIEALMRQH